MINFTDVLFIDWCLMCFLVISGTGGGFLENVQVNRLGGKWTGRRQERIEIREKGDPQNNPANCCSYSDRRVCLLARFVT